MFNKSVLFLLYVTAWLPAAFELYPEEQFFTNNTPLIFTSSNQIKVNIALQNGRPFQLPGLRYHYQSMTGAWNRHRLQLSHFQLGNKLYDESTFALQYGYKIHYPVIAFLSLQRYNLQIQNYGQAGTFGLSLGLAYRYKSTLNWQFSLRNVNQPRIGRSGDPLPVVALLNCQWQPVPSVTGQVRWNQDLSRTGDPLQTVVWLTFAPFSQLQLTSGYGSQPVRLLGSVTLSWFNCNFFYEVIYYHGLSRLSTRAGLNLFFDRPGIFSRPK